MSATEQMRAMLDGLMGTARDGSDSQRQHLHFTDSKVCRAFLLDCCPHDIFASTKLELGDCSKVHDPALRADYILANKDDDYMYEISALEKLQQFVNDADKKTDFLKRKLAETQEELTAEETSKLNRVHELTEILGKKLAQVEKAEADDLDLEAKQKLIDEAEKIKKERLLAETEYRNVSRPASSHQQQNLRVCDICSAYLGINDNDSRLADHFGGKLHLGFITVREKLEDLKKIVAEKKGLSRGRGSSGSINHIDGGSSRSRDYDSMRYRDRGGDRYHHNSRERERDRPPRESRYRGDNDSYYRSLDDNRYRERDRSRSSSRYYVRESTTSSSSRPKDRYRDERQLERGVSDRVSQSDRLDGGRGGGGGGSESSSSRQHDSIFSSSKNGRGGSDSTYPQERELTYQRRLRELEKREAEKARKYAIRASEEKYNKQLEEQESRKLKEFLEDYKDDRDDYRFYRGSALTRRLADRRKEIELDEMSRQKEKMELEMLSRSCAVLDNNNSSLSNLHQPIDQSAINEQIESSSSSTNYNNNHHNNNYNNNNPSAPNGDSNNLRANSSEFNSSTSIIKNEPYVNNIANSSTSTSSLQTNRPPTSIGGQQQTAAAATPANTNSAAGLIKSSTSEDKRKQVEELIGSIPTDKDQLFARKLDWSLLDENLMEKRIRPWVTKKIAEYMGEKVADLIDFVCGLLTAHTDGAKVLREVAVVLDDEAEKFVVHMWRLLIFELEAKKIGLRK